MKRARKRLMDIATTLGLSNTVMRLISQRTSQDKFILYGGMLVTLVLMYFIYSYFS
jgi:Golgi SNAP receptor complex protein 2